MRQKTIEDYCKNIYLLGRQGEVHAVDLAREMGITKTSVSNALKNLSELGYVSVDAAHVLTLTRQGLKVAEHTTQTFAFFYNLLFALGVSADTARTDACRLEHAISDESLRALMCFGGDRRELQILPKQVGREGSAT